MLPHSNSSSCVLCVPLEDEACVGSLPASRSLFLPISSPFLTTSQLILVPWLIVPFLSFSFLLKLIRTW